MLFSNQHPKGILCSEMYECGMFSKQALYSLDGKIKRIFFYRKHLCIHFKIYIHYTLYSTTLFTYKYLTYILLAKYSFNGNYLKKKKLKNSIGIMLLVVVFILKSIYCKTINWKDTNMWASVSILTCNPYITHTVNISA